MSDTTLRDLVLKRLDADTKPEDEWPALVLAALEGPAELEKLLEGPSGGSARAPSRSSTRARRSSTTPSPRILGLNSAAGCGAGGRFTMSLAPAEPSAWRLQVTEQSRLTPDSAVSPRSTFDGLRPKRSSRVVGLATELNRIVKTLEQACEPRDAVFDATRRDTVLNLLHLPSPSNVRQRSAT